MSKGVILITGCSSGIGLNLCNFFLEKKFDVIGISRTPFKKFKKKIRNRRFRFIYSDLSNVSEFKKLIIKLNKIPNIKYIINNAGMIISDDHDNKCSINKLFILNAIIPICLSRFFINSYKFRTVSKIFNIGSNAHSNFNLDKNDLDFRNTTNNYSTYCKSKLILLFLTKKLYDLHSKKVGIYYLHPGFVRTKIFFKLPYIQKIFYKLALNLFGISSSQSSNYLGNIIISKKKQKGGYFKYKDEKSIIWPKLSKKKTHILWKNFLKISKLILNSDVK